jgi:hypothetical protein
VYRKNYNNVNLAPSEPIDTNISIKRAQQEKQKEIRTENKKKQDKAQGKGYANKA